MAGRGSFGESYSSSQQNGSSTNSYSAYRETSSNDFLRLSQVVSNNIQKITQNVAQMNNWLSQYGTKQDTAELHEKVHDMQHYTNQLAKETGNYTKELNKIPPPSNPSEVKQQKIQKDRLLNEFTQALTSFQSTQRLEKEKEKTSVVQARTSMATSSKAFNDPFADSPSGYDYSSSSTQQHQMNVQIDASDVDMELLREREEALRKLETDIMDVNQIFKDLGAMVHEQGEMIDSIESNVEHAGVSVEEGTEQLRQARDYQTKSRKKKCICIILILVILAIIVIILAATLSTRSG